MGKTRCGHPGPQVQQAKFLDKAEGPLAFTVDAQVLT